MKKYALPLLMFVGLLPASAQTELREAIEEIAEDNRYVVSVRTNGQEQQSDEHPYYSIYECEFAMPRKVGRKTVEDIIEAYNEDARSPNVTMKVLRVGKAVGLPSPVYSIHYATGLQDIHIGEQFDNFAMIRTTSPRGADYRLIYVVEWSEVKKKTVGRTHIVESLSPEAFAQRKKRMRYFDWSNGEGNIELLNDSSVQQALAMLKDSSFHRMFENWKTYDRMDSAEVSKQLEQLEKNLEKFSSSDLEELLSKLDSLGLKKTAPGVLRIRKPKPKSLSPVPTPRRQVRKNTLIASPSAKTVTPLRSPREENAYRNFKRRLDFCLKSYTGSDNDYNEALIEYMVKVGRPALKHMSLSELEDTKRALEKLQARSLEKSFEREDDIDDFLQILDRYILKSKGQ